MDRPYFLGRLNRKAPIWKLEHRRAVDRRCLRSPSDVTNTEWALVPPLISLGKRGGRRRKVDVREVLNTISMCFSPGISVQSSLAAFRSAVEDYLDLRIGTGRAGAFTEQSTRRPSSRRGGERDDGDHRHQERRRRRGLLVPQGFDPDRDVLGRKRHVLVDALGLLFNVDMNAVSVHDRDGVEILL